MLRKKCIICGNTILVKESHAKIGWGKYCSKDCQFKGQNKGKYLNCDYCSKEIYRTPRDFKKSKSGKFFCSRKCHCAWENENKRCAENSPNWIAGHSVYRRLMKRNRIEEAKDYAEQLASKHSDQPIVHELLDYIEKDL